MVGIREVAARAGVSKMTVSRVLNDNPLVSAEARARVLRAMAELNYTPSALARNLKAGRAQLLGVLIPDTTNPIYGLYVDGIKDAAYAAGYGVIVCKTGHDASVDAMCYRLLREHRVAGAVLTYAGWWDYAPPLVESGVALVTIDHRSIGCDRVTIDNLTAMGQAVDHLADLGHRVIGLICGPLNAISERERLAGFRRALRRRDLALDSRWQIAAANFDDASAGAATRALLAARDRPSALVVSSSGLTPGVLAATVAMGYSIPGDLALVGVGELTWTPSLVSPVTSLIEPAYEMGRDACQLLLERVTSARSLAPRRVYHQARLAVRLSCGAPSRMRDPAVRAPHMLLFEAATTPEGTPPAGSPAPQGADAAQVARVHDCR